MQLFWKYFRHNSKYFARLMMLPVSQNSDRPPLEHYEQKQKGWIITLTKLVIVIYGISQTKVFSIFISMMQVFMSVWCCVAFSARTLSWGKQSTMRIQFHREWFSPPFSHYRSFPNNVGANFTIVQLVNFPVDWTLNTWMETDHFNSIILALVWLCSTSIIEIVLIIESAIIIY